MNLFPSENGVTLAAFDQLLCTVLLGVNFNVFFLHLLAAGVHAVYCLFWADLVPVLTISLPEKEFFTGFALKSQLPICCKKLFVCFYSLVDVLTTCAKILLI